MTAIVAPRDVARFERLVASGLGLRMSDRPDVSLALVLDARAARHGESVPGYLDRLEADWPATELGELAREMTVAETYFFRDDAQLRALAEVVVPDRMRGRAATDPLRVLSAGCATGEEPYSIAMVLHDVVADPGRWDIVGVDVNRAALEAATAGVYSSWALRATPAAMRQRWFHLQGGKYVLAQAIRRSVVFEQHNLVADDPDLWKPGHYDVIFCRNVLMYLTPSGADRVVAAMVRALAPGGYLFLGGAESLRGMAPGMRLCHSHGRFYYQRLVGPDTADGPGSDRPDASRWSGEVGRAVQRIQALADRVADRRPGVAGTSAVARAQWDDRVHHVAARVMGLVDQERYDAALEVVASLDVTADQAVLMVRAALCAAGGRLAEAEEFCHLLGGPHGGHAGACHVWAVCRQARGDIDGAAYSYGRAANLDPRLAMPRLHLGLLAARTGDHALARDQLAQALALLPGEPAWRISLFGGGFSRHGLGNLCRSQLASSDGVA